MGAPRRSSAKKPTGSKPSRSADRPRGSGQKPQPKLIPPTQPAETIRILSPRTGDILPWQFTVTGTYSLPSAPLTLTLTGVIFATVPLNSDADGIWSKTFTASMDGKCNATASAVGSSSDAVDFEVLSQPPITLGNPSIVPPPPPLAGPAGLAATRALVTVPGEHRDPGTPPIFVRLLYSDETQQGKKMADHHAAGKYKAQFPDVDPGLYIVLAETKIMSKSVQCSRVKEV
jgi:hypothetical protein